MQKNASLIYDFMTGKENLYSFIHKNGAKIYFPYKESSPRSSDSALRCSTTKLQSSTESRPCYYCVQM